MIETLLLTILGPALIAIPVWVWLFMHRQYPFLVYGALLMIAPSLATVVIDLPQTHQLLLFVVVYLQFALVWAILQVIEAWRMLPRPPLAGFAAWGATGLVAAVALFNVALLIVEFRGSFVLEFKSIHLVLSEESGKHFAGLVFGINIFFFVYG